MDDHIIYDLTVVHVLKGIFNLAPRASKMLQTQALPLSGTAFNLVLPIILSILGKGLSPEKLLTIKLRNTTRVVG